jgi:hypothetical protein
VVLVSSLAEVTELEIECCYASERKSVMFVSMKMATYCMLYIAILANMANISCL